MNIFQIEANPVQMRCQCFYSVVMANSKLDYYLLSETFIFEPVTLRFKSDPIECVQCHAIKNKIKNRALDKVKKFRYCKPQIKKTVFRV